jgi:hypothetical protein
VVNISKRIYILIAIFVLTLSNLGNLEVKADTVAPVVKSITVDPKEVSPGGVVTVTVDVEDLDSGIYSVTVFFRGPDGIALMSAGAILNENTGKYEAKLTIGSNHLVGLWKLDQINVWDHAYNSDYVKRDRLVNLENADFTVMNADYDVTPPSVQSVKADKDRVGEGDILILSVEATDTQTGVLSVTVYYRNGGYLIGGPAEYNPTTGTYERVIRIGSTAAIPLGNWSFYSVAVEDKNHNRAEYYSVPFSNSFHIVEKTIDLTRPTTPVVNGVSDADYEVTGKTDSYTDVTVKIGNLTFRGTSDRNGYFSVRIPRQIAGTVIMITASDYFQNKSPAVEIIVLDGTAPDAPQVDKITNVSQNITGVAEKNSLIEVKRGTEILGSTVAGDDGIFLLKTDKILVWTGDKLAVTATDKAGNKSLATIVVVTDGMPPAYVTVNEVSDQSKEVTGITENGARVKVTIGTAIYSALADSQGNYKVFIPRQKANTQLRVTAADSLGNTTEPMRVFVIDRTAPAIPTVDTVSNLSKMITGRAEPKSSVTATIGTWKSTVIADVRGNFHIPISPQKAGTRILVTARDASGNISFARSLKTIDKIASDR